LNDFLIEFIGQKPELILTILALLIGTLGVSTAIFAKQISIKNRLNDKLEADSAYQLNQNRKDIERILSEPLGHLKKSEEKISLHEFMDGKTKITNIKVNNGNLEKLSKYFSEYCGNLNKYFENIIPTKKVCFVFQEHCSRAKQIEKMFDNANYSDIPLEFAKLHLKNIDLYEF
jgi:hypothetical protein